MTVAVLPPNPLRDLKKVEQDIYALVQGRTGGVQYPAGIAPPFGYTPSNAQTVVDAAQVPLPTGLAATWVTSYDQSFIDVEWVPPTGAGAAQVDEYEVEFNRTGFGVAGFGRTGGTELRSNIKIEPNSNYTIRVRAINNDIARSSAWTASVSVDTGADAKIPGQVTGVILSAGVREIIIRWTKRTEHDVDNGAGLYEVQLATDAAFTMNVRLVRTGGTITAFGDVISGTMYWGRVRAIDSGGNEGAWSAIVSGIPGQAGSGDIQAASITADHIIAGAIYTYHMTANSINADRLMVNTLNANRLTTSELNAAIVTIAATGYIRGGRTSSPFHYYVEDEAGFRFYANGSSAYSGGTIVFEVRTSDGSAYFGGSLIAGVSINSPTITGGAINGTVITGGTVRTAASGKSISMDGTSNGIVANTGDGGQAVGSLTDANIIGSGGTRRLYWHSLSPSFHNHNDPNYSMIRLHSKSFDGSVAASAEIRAAGASIIYTGSKLTMYDAAIQLRSDIYHQVRYAGGGDNAALIEGLDNVILRCLNGDVSEHVDSVAGGVGVGRVKTRWQTGGGWRDHEAGTHINSSDPATKADIRPAPQKGALKRNRNTPIYIFKGENDNYAKDRMGPMSIDLPAHMIYESDIYNDKKQKVGVHQGVGTREMDGELWLQIQELTDLLIKKNVIQEADLD